MVATEEPRYVVPTCHEAVGILHEDAHLLVIEKPAFLLSQPGRGPLNSDCVIGRLQKIYTDALLVHRLDLDTSGIMVFARGREAQAHLNRQFAERQVEKEYIADVAGSVDRDQGEIDLPIAPDWDNRPRQKICADSGKKSLTRYQVLHRDRDNGFSRLLLKPLTGRSHQLRIHLMSIGHAILGCDLYAPPEVLAQSPRLRLHATRLTFYHPRDAQRVSFQSALPF